MWFLVWWLPMAVAVIRFGGSSHVLQDGLHRLYDNATDMVVAVRVANGEMEGAVPWQPESETLVSLERGPCVSAAPIPVTNAIQVVAGSRHACALTAAMAVLCWGDNSFCQLGPHYEMKRGVMLGAVLSFQFSRQVRLLAFSTVTCAIDTAGTGECWGSMHRNIESCTDRHWHVADASRALLEVVSSIGVHSVIAFGRTNAVTVTGGRAWTASGVALRLGPITFATLVDGFLVLDAQRCSRNGCEKTNNNPAPPAVDVPCVIDREGGVVCMGNPWIDVVPLVYDLLVDVSLVNVGRVTGTVGCGHALWFDGVLLAGTVKSYANGVTQMGADGSLWCVRLLGCTDVLPPLVPLGHVVDIAAGSSHMCVLDSAGVMACIGDSSSCQFIGNGSTWTVAPTPVVATRIYAHANITCATSGVNVFCTGCVLTNCMCRMRVTLAMASTVKSVAISPHGFCVQSAFESKCVGRDYMLLEPSCYQTNLTIQCGEYGYTTKDVILKWVSSTSAQYVAIMSESEFVVSVNGLRSVASINNK